MKTLLSLLVLLFAINITSMAQVNRYDQSAGATFNNTYVSPNYGALMELGTLINAREAKIRNTIIELKQLYYSYPKYPTSLACGWHDVIFIIEENNALAQLKAYVNNNNEITQLKENGEYTNIRNLKVIKGKASRNGNDIYFFEDIWQYNNQ